MMYSQHENDVRFTLTRSILLSDLLAFRDFLISKGHEVALSKPCKGGIDFSPRRSGSKDLRWCGFSGTSVDATSENFVQNPSTIARQYLVGSPEWHRDNNIDIKLRGTGVDKFSEEERRDIREGMVSCLGVIDNVIFNRKDNRFVVLPEDESRYVDIFVESEIRRWTIASTDFPLELDERLFQCWRCKEDKSKYYFDVVEYEDPSFYEFLQYFVTSDAPCCNDCAIELTRCDTPLPREVLVSQELTKKRRKT
jgi:hypothetical protein